jgi:hypothetical protein
VQGICDFLAEAARRDHGLDADPLTDFVICCGQSEAFAAAIFASSTANAHFARAAELLVVLEHIFSPLLNSC